MAFFVSLSDKRYNQTAGSELKKVPLLEGVLEPCKTMLIDDGKKGKHGQIFPYINNRLGREYWPDKKIYNGGVIFMDIDWITKECAEKIFNSFDTICEQLEFVLAMQYSASYYTSKDKAGLHIYIASYELDNREYPEQARFAYMLTYKMIEKLTGYDLRKWQLWDDEHDKYGSIIDMHNAEMTQRFNLYYSDFKFNSNARAFDDRWYASYEDNLKEYYKDFIVKPKPAAFIMSDIVDDDYEATGIDLPSKIKVDRKLMVGTYSGSDLRWRIAAISNNLFGSKAKEWCDRYFYFEDNKSIWQAARYDSNRLVLNWLINKGLIRSTLDNSLDFTYNDDGMEVKSYLAEEYYEFIKSKIEEHKCITIIGDPGIGKTNCIGKIAKEMNGVILTPVNAMRKLYTKNGIDMVDKTNRDTFDYGSNPCVCVYDQFTKIKDKTSGKTVFVDESHVLFKDRNYREALIDVANVLKKWEGKIVIISATPLDETKALGSEETLKFWKRRARINVTWRNVDKLNDMKYLAEKIVTQNIQDERYTHICLFGNRSPRMIYDNLTVYFGREIHNKVNIFHRDYESIGDIDRVTENEVLDKKVNLGTSLVYNGLNFNNEGAKMLVVIEYEEGSSGWWDIIQACTRIRKSRVVVYVIAAREKEEKMSLDDKIRDAKILAASGIDRKLIGFNTNYVEHEDVVRELADFAERECSIGNAIEYLRKVKWMKLDVVEAEDLKIETNKRNLLRSRIDNIIKKQLNGEELTKDETKLIEDGKEYYDRTIESIDKMCFEYGITASDIIKLNNSETIGNDNSKTVTLGTTMDHIDYNVIASLDDKEYWDNVSRYLEKQYVSSPLYKQRKKAIEKITKTWEKWHQLYFNELSLAANGGHGDVTSMIHDMIEENKAKNVEKSRKRAAAGKRGTKRVKDIETGIVYESKSACADAIGMSIAYVSVHKDRFVAVF